MTTMTAIPDLIAWLHTVLRNVLVGYPLASLDDKFLRAPNPYYEPDNGQDPYIVIDVAEAADLLARLTAPSDEELETTAKERADYTWPSVTGFVPRLLRDFEFTRAKLRVAEERADAFERIANQKIEQYVAARQEADRYEEALKEIKERIDSGDDSGAYSVLRAALDPEPKP
jgi:hypothetical protein